MFARPMIAFSLLMFSLIGADQVEAQGYSPRQYYSSWQQHPTANYHFRRYYYKPSPTYVGYKHHYVVYTPQQPKYVYFYNPYSRQYWGRCPVNTNGQGQYSLLAEKDRKASLKDIPESAFPAPAQMPPIPESSDKATLDLPPDDLPDVQQPGVSVPSAPAE